MLSTTYDNLASAQYALDNYDQPLAADHESLTSSQQAATPGSTGRILNNIGWLYKTLGESHKSRDYYRQSLNTKQAVSNTQSIAMTTMNLGKVLWELGHTAEASHHYLKVFKLREKIGNPYKTALILNAMVEVALHNKNYNRAHEYARKLKAIGDSTGN